MRGQIPFGRNRVRVASVSGVRAVSSPLRRVEPRSWDYTECVSGANLERARMKRTGAPATSEGSITAAAKAVAMGRGLTPKSTSGLFGFAVLLLIEQVVLFFALVDRDIELGTYVELHLFCCLVLMCYLAWHPGTLQDRDISALQIVGWSAIAGPFGAFVALALTLRRGAVATDSQSVPDTSTD